MNCGRIPLFPGGCDRERCVRMSLFGDDCGCGGDWRGCCDNRSQRVRVCNPARPGEYADVELSVDQCGNLTVCVHRPPTDCCDRRKRCRMNC